MVLRVRPRPFATRAGAVLALSALLAGCGSSAKRSQAAAEDSSRTCPEAVLATLGSVLQRVYREGVSSERTGAAKHVIESSLPLREAVLKGDAAAATAAGRALIAGGHLTNLQIKRGSQVLVNLGGPALTPLHGSLPGPGGKPIAHYKTSVWSDSGFLAEGDGVAEGSVVLRAGGANVGGSPVLGPGSLPDEGTLTRGGVAYQYTSFPAEAYPSGALRVYLMRPVRSTGELCGASAQDTVVNTLSRVAHLIYRAEGGNRTLSQVHRVQANVPLLEAVARRDPAATRAAVAALLNQHIVRLRVSTSGGQLLADDGGPFVLAPVTAPLKLGGRTIGSFVLSIQDDEGYLRLTRRLAGLSVLMYMNPGQSRLVKNSLGPSPGRVPASGAYSYRGREFRVITVHGRAFPSGPLLIRVLVPIPYS
jgi:hypothetical protein